MPAIRPSAGYRTSDKNHPSRLGKGRKPMLIQGTHQTRVWLRSHLRFILIYLSAVVLCALAGGWLGSLPPPAGREIMRLLVLPLGSLAAAVGIVIWLRRTPN